MRKIIYDAADKFGAYTLTIDIGNEVDYVVDLKNDSTIALINCLLEMVDVGQDAARDVLRKYGISAKRPSLAPTIEIPVLQYDIPIQGQLG